ncbi:MAG TPA: hypothetical protein VLV86_25110 [Vicinamibacterales bacterium]|nr:hypothetical protein [Vicinamibacterales bacterium]
MSFGFDGLRTILGNTAVAVPEVGDAPPVEAVETVEAVAVAMPEPPSEVPAQANELPEPSPDLNLQSAPALADIPDLSELDRGLYPPDGTSRADALHKRLSKPHTDDDATLSALGRGLDQDDDLAEFAVPATSNATTPSTFADDLAALELDDSLFASVPVPPEQRRASRPAVSTSPAVTAHKSHAVGHHPEDPSERRVGPWAAAAVMACGLFLGASGAAVVFHDHVSHIVATWQNAPGHRSPAR